MSSSQHQENSNSDTSNAENTEAGNLHLQLKSEDRSEQKICLKNRKSTIGSHDQCSVVLHSQTVQPLHCMVIQGTAGTIVRNFHADTRLNGESVGDAWLELGDTISVGNVDLKHVDESGETPAEPIAESTREIEARSQQVLELIDRLSGLEQELGDLKESSSHLEQKADAFEQQVTEKLDEIDRLEKQNEDLASRLEFTRQDREMIQELEAQAQEITSKTAELETALEKKNEIIEQFASQNSTLASQLSQLREQPVVEPETTFEESNDSAEAEGFSTHDDTENRTSDLGSETTTDVDAANVQDATTFEDQTAADSNSAESDSEVTEAEASESNETESNETESNETPASDVDLDNALKALELIDQARSAEFQNTPPSFESHPGFETVEPTPSFDAEQSVGFDQESAETDDEATNSDSREPVSLEDCLPEQWTVELSNDFAEGTEQSTDTKSVVDDVEAAAETESESSEDIGIQSGMETLSESTSATVIQNIPPIPLPTDESNQNENVEGTENRRPNTIASGAEKTVPLRFDAEYDDDIQNEDLDKLKDSIEEFQQSMDVEDHPTEEPANEQAAETSETNLSETGDEVVDQLDEIDRLQNSIEEFQQTLDQESQESSVDSTNEESATEETTDEVPSEDTFAEDTTAETPIAETPIAEETAVEATADVERSSEGEEDLNDDLNRLQSSIEEFQQSTDDDVEAEANSENQVDAQPTAEEDNEVDSESESFQQLQESIEELRHELEQDADSSSEQLPSSENVEPAAEDSSNDEETLGDDFDKLKNSIEEFQHAMEQEAENENTDDVDNSVESRVNEQVSDEQESVEAESTASEPPELPESFAGVEPNDAASDFAAENQATTEPSQEQSAEESAGEETSANDDSGISTEAESEPVSDDLDFNFELAESNFAGAFAELEEETSSNDGTESNDNTLEYSETTEEESQTDSEFSDEQTASFFEAVNAAENENPYSAFLTEQDPANQNSGEEPEFSEAINETPEQSEADASDSFSENYSQVNAEENETEEELSSFAGFGGESSEPESVVTENPFAPLQPLEENSPEAGAAEEDSAQQHQPAEPAPANPSGNGEDSYIQEYMKKLLGSEDEPQPAPEQKEEPVEEESPSLLEKTFEAELKEREEMLKPSEFVPKSAAPEKNSNLQAMRELANQTARSAIEVSSRKRKIEQLSMFSLIAAGICFFIGASLAMISKSMLSLPAIASVIFFAGTGIGAWFYFELKHNSSKFEAGEETKEGGENPDGLTPLEPLDENLPSDDNSSPTGLSAMDGMSPTGGLTPLDE